MHSSQKRQSKSCKRCLKRKQRCHGFPVCVNCEKANLPCEQSDFALQLHRHDDTYAALKRIQTLEAQLEHALSELSAVRQGQSQTQTHQIPSDESSSTARKDDSQRESSHISYNSPRPGTSPRVPGYTGQGALDEDDENHRPSTHPRSISGEGPMQSQAPFSGGASIASPATSQSLTPQPIPTLEHIAQATVWMKALPPTFSENISFAGLTDLQKHSAEPPNDEIGLRIINAYFEKIHPRYPFLHRFEIVQLHTRRHGIVGSSSGNRFETFKLNMVYAIGATLLQQTEPYAELQPESFFIAALQHVSAVRQSHPLQNIEAMALLVLYNLRSPSNSGIWHMIGLAMRTCIDLGLHRESSYSFGTPLQVSMKRRLFWTIYSLDRIIALSLRRPFGITEQDIDTRVPNSDDCLPGEKETQSNSTNDNQNKSSSSLTIWIRFIQIKRLESRIYSEVYSLNEPQQLRFARVRSLLESLDTWVRCLPVLTESCNNYTRLLSSKAVLLLLRPFLGMMRPDDPLMVRCLNAAGQVCEAFKQMHQRDAYSHSFVSAHSTFNAGITMCYCLFLNPLLLTPAVSNSLRACSSTMFVMAERSPRFRKHRDVLEDIISRVMESAGKASTSLGHVDNLQAKYIAEHDILAVQSLMELSAQQDPLVSIDTPEPKPSASQPRVSQVAEPVEQFGGFHPRDFWNEDRYSFQMLDEMMALESGPW